MLEVLLPMLSSEGLHRLALEHSIAVAFETVHLLRNGTEVNKPIDTALLFLCSLVHSELRQASECTSLST